MILLLLTILLQKRTKDRMKPLMISVAICEANLLLD